MGQVIAFKKPLSLPHSAPPDAGALAAAFYAQCRYEATAQAINAHRENPALNIGKLAGALTRTFAEDMIAQKMLESAVEGNPEKRAVAAALEALITRKGTPRVA